MKLINCFHNGERAVNNYTRKKSGVRAFEPLSHSILFFFGGMRMQTRIVKHLTKKKWHEKLEKKIDRNEIRIRRRKKNLSETRTYEMLLDESKKK